MVQLPRHRKGANTKDVVAIFELNLIEWYGESEVGDPSQERRYGDLKFCARERLSEALMDTVPKSDMVTRRTRDVKFIRIAFERLGVSVADVAGDNETVTLSDRLT
jgi:hypothetical protein